MKAASFTTRIGWTDAVAARYAVGINGPMKLILTKVDSVAGASMFKLCYNYGSDSLPIVEFNPDSEFLRHANPSHRSYEGYSDIQRTRTFNELPPQLKVAIGEFERFVGAPVVAISVGPEREQTIIRD